MPTYLSKDLLNIPGEPILRPVSKVEIYLLLTFGNTAFSTIYPNIPATIVPSNTPNFAWFSRSGYSPAKERLAINKDTVKPIPPNKDTPATLLQFIPGGIEDKPLLTASQVNRKIPINLPRSNPAATAILTAPTTPPPPLNTTPALAKAKSGSITKFTAPCKLSSKDCKGLIT